VRLFIAEKPSVAKALAAELGGAVTRADGCLRCGSDVVTWCFGHLLAMAMPEDYFPIWRTWRFDDLPLRPSAWKLLPRKDTKKQLTTIGKLLKEASEVVHAGDPDREGQLLVDEVLEHFRYSGRVQRFWVSAQDSVSIQRGLKALRDNLEFRGLRNAALGRGRADWLVGINLSRAYTLQAQAVDADAGVRTVGRVQTPTLNLVVERDRAIAAFRPVPHYTVSVLLDHANGSFHARWQPLRDQKGLDTEGRLLDPAVASAVVSKALGQVGALVEYLQQTRKESQPKAFTLTRLTLEASNRWGYTAEEVLKACQALYETHKLASYPRTDCEYLPESQHQDAPRVLAALRQVCPSLAAPIVAANPQLKSPTWNDAKVTAHHGIIPTMHVGDASALSATERNVYELIVRSYLAQFYPAHEFLHTTATTEIVGERFSATGKVVTREGWRAVFGAARAHDGGDEESSASQKLPPMQKGDQVVCANAERKDLKTKPPPRFTEGTLQVAMESIYKVVSDPEERRILHEEDGIGTPATRATIIAELKRRGFLRLSGKHLVSTDLGQHLVDGLPAAIKSPSLTAIYERTLKEIEQGRQAVDAFLKRQEEFVNTQVTAVTDGKTTASTSATAAPGHTCPECKEGALRRIARKDGTGHFWGCSKYKSGCKATFKDKDGQPVLDKQPARPAAEHEHKCPKCGDGVLRRTARKDGTGHFWGCSKYKSGCKAIFKDKDGQPVLEPEPSAGPRSPAPAKPAGAPEALPEHKCPSCQAGRLRRIARKDGSGHFWGCDQYKAGCKAIFKDKDGQPLLELAPCAGPRSPVPAKPAGAPESPLEHKCPSCQDGRLRRIARKDGSGHFWGCDQFRNGCKATFPDKDGAPNLTPPGAKNRGPAVKSSTSQPQPQGERA
jgi:DNA topoisomerase-3